MEDEGHEALLHAFRRGTHVIWHGRFRWGWGKKSNNVPDI